MSGDALYRGDNGVNLAHAGHCYRRGLGYNFDGGIIRSITRGMKESKPTITLTGLDNDIIMLGASFSSKLGIAVSFADAELDDGRVLISSVELQTGDIETVMEFLSSQSRKHIPEYAKEFILEQEQEGMLAERIRRIATSMNQFPSDYATVESQPQIVEFGDRIQKDADKIASQLGAKSGGAAVRGFTAQIDSNDTTDAEALSILQRRSDVPKKYGFVVSENNPARDAVKAARMLAEKAVLSRAGVGREVHSIS